MPTRLIAAKPDHNACPAPRPCRRADRLGSPALAQPRETRGAAAGAFDFYVLALSWSPGFCEAGGSAKGRDQCGPDAASASWCTGSGRRASRDFRAFASRAGGPCHGMRSRRRGHLPGRRARATPVAEARQLFRARADGVFPRRPHRPRACARAEQARPALDRHQGAGPRDRARLRRGPILASGPR